MVSLEKQADLHHPGERNGILILLLDFKCDVLQVITCKNSNLYVTLMHIAQVFAGLSSLNMADLLKKILSPSDGDFEPLDVAPLSTPPELPDVMKPQETSSSHQPEAVAS